MEAELSVLVCTFAVFFLLPDALQISADETTLYLLNVVPYQDDRPFAGWDRGFELIPAGDLAIEQINNRSDILPGYRLELVDIESEACGVSTISTGYVNFYRHLVQQPNSPVVGVVGLFCSTVTAAISSISNRPEIDYIQVAGSISPKFQNVTAYPRLYRTISSAIIFNKATLRLMDKFGWNRISSIHDNSGVFFLTTADDFVSKVNNATLELVTRIPTSLSHISDAFANLRDAGARIVYALLTTAEAANLMCEAYKGEFVWPGYVYIFHERTFQELLESETACDEGEMTEALHGIFLLQYRLRAEPNDTLVSGWTFEEYHNDYLMRLAEFATATGMELQNNSYANVLHDEVWAIALALNNSLETLKSLNETLTDYGFGQFIITDTIASNLKNISFQGAAGYIEFDSNQEAGSSINIIQVQKGQPVLVGVYNLNEDNLTLTDLNLLSTVPADQFEEVYNLLPQWLTITILCVCGLAYILTTAILVLFLYWRNELPEIKATSIYLSLVMFTGCYLLFTAAVTGTIHRSFVMKSDAFTAMCIIDIWFGFIGLNLIFGTLFMRLLRVYYVFRVFRKTSKLWSDQFLFLGVMLICSGEGLILLLWTVSGMIHLETSKTYVPSTQPPHYSVTTSCSSTNFHIWLAVAFSYAGLIIIFVMFLAIQTRHIERKNFKDTKKVNAFIYTLVGVLTITIPMWYVLDSTRLTSLIGGHIAVTIGYLSAGLLCQFFLFAPKTLPIVFHLKCTCISQ